MTKESENKLTNNPELDILIMELVFRVSALEKVLIDKGFATPEELQNAIKQHVEKYKETVENGNT